jgi:hypothetical protein
MCCGVLWGGRGGEGPPARPGQAPHAAAPSLSIVVPVEETGAGEGSFWGQVMGSLMVKCLLILWLTGSSFFNLVFSEGFELCTGRTAVATRCGARGVTVDVLVGSTVSFGGSGFCVIGVI